MIESYHAHVYFDADTMASVTDLRSAMLRDLGDRVAISTLRDRPVGPHPLPMFEVQIPLGRLEAVVAWLMLHHDSHSVLVHPVTGDDVRDHRDHPLWLGAPLPLDLASLA